jgi:hypothetical protein
MCLYVSPTQHPHPASKYKRRALRAGYDILVWKKANMPGGAESFFSPHRFFRWYFGKLEKVRLRKNAVTVRQGLHAYFRKPSAITRQYGTYYPAIIPAGSLFYIGMSGDIATNAMVVYRNMDEVLKGRHWIRANFSKHKAAK